MTLEKLSLLDSVFQDNKWDMEDEYYKTVFERFCRMLKDFDDVDFDLVIELTKRYKVIRDRDYENLIFDCYRRLKLYYKSSKERFYILPVLKKKDVGKSKSGLCLQYKFKGNEFGVVKGNYIVKTIDDYLKIPSLSKTDQIILVDDYVGSSETADTCLKELREIKPEVQYEDISIITIAIQYDGLSYLRSLGINVFCNKVVKKGISDFYELGERNQHFETMRSIEDRLKGLDVRKYRFGYRSSEALISLSRTPNNTFPVFWKSQKAYTAPFTRFL